jgi:hypothetical protein
LLAAEVGGVSTLLVLLRSSLEMSRARLMLLQLCISYRWRAELTPAYLVHADFGVTIAPELQI